MVVLAIVCGIANRMHARDSMEHYMRATAMMEGMILLPPHMATADFQTASQLLLTNNDLIAMAAARRLGELAPVDAVPVLTKRFFAIPYYARVQEDQAMSATKLEILRALGRTNSEEGKQALMSILSKCWSDGPLTSVRRKTDIEYECVIAVCANALSRWASDSDVAKLASELCASRKMNTCGRASDYVTCLRLLGQVPHLASNRCELVGHVFDALREVDRAGNTATFSPIEARAWRIILLSVPPKDIDAYLTGLKEQHAEVSKEIDRREKACKTNDDYDKLARDADIKITREKKNQLSLKVMEVETWKTGNEWMRKQPGGIMCDPTGINVVTGCFLTQWEHVIQVGTSGVPLITRCQRIDMTVTRPESAWRRR